MRTSSGQRFEGKDKPKTEEDRPATKPANEHRTQTANLRPENSGERRLTVRMKALAPPARMPIIHKNQ
jgi:hypothetical protein